MMKSLFAGVLCLGCVALAANADAQNVFVTNFFTNTVAGFSTTTGAPVATFSGGDANNSLSFPIGLATDPLTGNLYTTSINTNTGASTIFRLGPSGVQTAVSNTSPAASTLYNPKGIAFGPGNQLFVSNGGTTLPSAGNSFVGTANVLTGSYNNYTGGGGSPINSPYGIAYDGVRYLYVNNGPQTGPAVTSSTAVIRIDTTNATAVALNLQAAAGTPAINYNFSGLTFGPDGALYVADGNQGNILRIATPTGNTSAVSAFALGTAFPGGLKGLEGLAFDPTSPTNDLYFALDDDTIRRVTPTGTVATGFMGSVYNGFTISEDIGSGPTFLAFSPIPEPSTYALFGTAGATLLVVFSFRRRQVSLTMRA